MIYVLSVLFAGLIILGQSLWKISIEKTPIQFNITFLLSREMLKIVLSIPMIAGFIAYGIATLIYLLLIGKYDYSLVQSLTIPLTLIIAYIIASVFFKETIAVINIVGLLLIVSGVILAVRR